MTLQQFHVIFVANGFDDTIKNMSFVPRKYDIVDFIAKGNHLYSVANVHIIPDPKYLSEYQDNLAKDYFYSLYMPACENRIIHAIVYLEESL